MWPRFFCNRILFPKPRREREDMERVSLEQRGAILNAEIRRYVSNGYRVQSATSTTAQLVKPKKFSFFWALVWFLIFGVGILVYFAYYLAKKDRTVYVEVDESGKTTVA